MLAYTYISPGKFKLIDKPKPELQSMLGAMSIGRRICNEPTMLVARWQSSKRL